MRQIPFFNYPALYEQDEANLQPIISDVLRRGAYVMQQDLLDFETNLAAFLGVKHVIGVADGTVALVMGLRASGLGSGDEVLVPSHTFVASAAAIKQVGAQPVLVDCGADHLIDGNDLRRRITDRTRGIMPVQLNGRTARMDEILELASEFNLQIVEDSAQALGSKYKEKFAGTFGITGSCSFYPSKTLGCFGDGGAVFTDDDDAADYIKLLRDHGRSESGEVIDWGYNSRLDNVQAAILDFKLKSYPEKIERRRHIARVYQERLAGIDGLVLPPGPDDGSDHFDIYQNYEIEADRRDDLSAHLKKNGVGHILQWGGWMIHQFPKLRLNDDVPFTEALSKRFMLLPMNTSLSDDDVGYICEQLHTFYN